MSRWVDIRQWVDGSGRYRVIAGLVVGVIATGCQQYEPAPLDLQSHRHAVQQRLLDVEPLDGFARRLRQTDHRVPDRLTFEDGLTSAEAEVLALFFNPQVRLARLRAGVTRASFETAGLWSDPVFGFDGAEILSPSGPFEYGLVAELTIPISGRLEVARARAGAEHDAELRRVVHEEWALRAAVRRAWASWSAAEQRVELLRELLAQVDAVVVITDRLEAAGELSRIEARLFTIEMADRLTELARAEAATRGARQRLLALLGLTGVDPRLEHELVTLPPDPDSAEELDGLLIERNTLLAVRRAEYEVAEQTLRLEVRRQYPDLTIGTGYGNEDDDRLLLGVSIPVPILNANRGAIAEARAKRALARAAAEAAFEELSGQLAIALAERDAILTQLTALESKIAPLLARQLDEVRRTAELGEVDTPLLLESVTRQFAVKTRLIELSLARQLSSITIAELIGPPASLTPAPVSVEDGPSSRPASTRESNGDPQ